MLHRAISTSAPASESAEARDERLLRGIRAGEPRALEEAFFAYNEALFAFAYRYTRMREAAEDLIHDVFLRIWARRTVLTGEERLRPYLFGAVRNAALMWLRRERLERSHATRASNRAVERPAKGEIPAAEAQDVPGMSQFAADAADAVKRQDAGDLAEELREAVEMLPPKARQAITLRWQRQMRNAEIAEVMGVSVKTVEFSIARALNHLRRILDPP
ncbi:MAG: sigma-70 family RNA polymerase sigma factor [Gemmatimonadaceae bacterium]